MKKSLLILLSMTCSLFAFTQLPPPVTSSTSTGVVPNGNIATCNYPALTGANCVRVCRNSLVVTGDAVDANPRTVRFQYYKTSGNRSMHVVIQCGTTILVNDCLNVSADADNVLMYKEYTNLACLVKATMIISIQAYTNSTCGGGACAPLLVSTAGAPLPVTFESFTAKRTGEMVLLKWRTVSEQNSLGFAVERNTGGSWEEIGYVASLAPDGNSDQALDYSFSDINTIRGISQYRLRQVDKDGRYAYTDIRSVFGENQPVRLTVYPNPSVDGKVNITFDDRPGTRNLVVQDMNGRVLRQVQGVTTNNISFRDLQPGIYIIKVSDPQTGAESVVMFVVSNR